MQVSDTTGKQGLVQDIAFWLGNGIDLNNYSLADRIRNMNFRLDLIWTMIFEAYGGWKFMPDDISDTTTGVPYSDQTITSGTGLYGIPSAAITVDGVFMKSASTANWKKLIPLTYEQFIDMGGDGAFPSTGVPNYYLLQGDIIRLLPIPNFTLSTALRVYFDQNMTLFTTSDTTTVPGFNRNFHRMLSIGAALDYAMSHGLTDKVNYLSALWLDYERRLKLFYSKRYKELFPHNIGGGKDLMEEFA